ncbi:hypothetical protein OROMI_009228 [Orobanche minor]
MSHIHSQSHTRPTPNLGFIRVGLVRFDGDERNRDFPSDLDPCHGSGKLSHRRCGGIKERPFVVAEIGFGSIFGLRSWFGPRVRSDVTGLNPGLKVMRAFGGSRFDMSVLTLEYRGLAVKAGLEKSILETSNAGYG